MFYLGIIKMEFHNKRAVLKSILYDELISDLDLIAILRHLSIKRKKTHKMFLKRKSEGAYSILIERHLYFDDEKFFEYLRMPLSSFHTILNIISDDIQLAPSKRIRQPISPSQKLCIALRYKTKHIIFQLFSFDA